MPPEVAGQGDRAGGFFCHGRCRAAAAGAGRRHTSRTTARRASAPASAPIASAGAGAVGLAPGALAARPVGASRTWVGALAGAGGALRAQRASRTARSLAPRVGAGSSRGGAARPLPADMANSRLAGCSSTGVEAHPFEGSPTWAQASRWMSPKMEACDLLRESQGQGGQGLVTFWF